MPATSSSPELAPRPTQAEIDRRRGRVVPWIIGAFYVTFMAGFISFVVIAFHNPPNEITAQAYAKGLAYNDILAKAETQAKLGWTSQTVLQGGRVVFTLRDADGRPVDGASARAWFVHPNLKDLDRAFDLRPEGEGRYVASVDLPTASLWTVHVSADRDGHPYQSATTLGGR
ncbi:hypothetical protein ABAC460_07440 [Asticcacaulis sp. AC460]|uniref:FixH family protein n=1 Tax=Asticcacaulis sp. AC460 TaxID=1282360 RepID=UPI0003C3E3D3|nr:FixH family protein [Asticcacaulis sp. AC460]ESQ91057.1 hypothetical protein ABAC460_07440 [Asticcacaulis sp. AC460]